MNQKKYISPIILSGTDCIGGNGKAMVIAIWEENTKGKIRRMVNNSKDDKIIPLQEKFEVLAKRIRTFAIFGGATTFICLTIRIIFVDISDYRGELVDNLKMSEIKTIYVKTL